MFRLPIVKFFSRFVNRITITLALILVQVAWMASLYLRLVEYAAWLNVVMVVLSVLIILFLVRKDENPAYTIAWMALIGITPVFGGLMYLFWGNKRPSRRMRRRMEAVDRRHRGLVAQHPDQVMELEPRLGELSAYIAKYGPWPAWKDTSVQYFSSGEAMFPHLLEDLKKIRWKGEVLDVSASTGVCRAATPGKPFSVLYQEADRALYRAKAQGKGNCCTQELP